MRKLMTLTLASTAVVAIACGKDKAQRTAMSADLQRDLKLASATQDIRINPDEVTPQSKQDLALKPKKAPNGPKVIRTPHPTVNASAVEQQVAEIPTEVPQVQVAAAAPAPADSPSDAPPLARPSAMPTVNTPGGAGAGSERGSAGGGSAGGVLGGIFGAVLRGGIVGDDDHCDPRSAPRIPRGTVTDVSHPVGGGVFSGMGNARGIPGRGRP